MRQKQMLATVYLLLAKLDEADKNFAKSVSEK